jgi:hypothetical protein
MGINNQGIKTMKDLYSFARMLVRCLTLLFLLISSNGAVQGQTLNNKLPSVYLRFKEDVNDNDGEEMARLTLRNNTKWPIIVERRFEPTLKGDVFLTYVIELATGCRDERYRVDVVMSTTLKPGNVVSFAVPLDDFSQGSKIYVEFSFPWETKDNGTLRIHEPIHRAYFSAYDLPPRSKN